MVVTQENNKVLKQSAANSGSTFNICVHDKLVYQDLQLQVKLKAASGKEDQGGGLVWRYIDKNNYYIVRAKSFRKKCCIVQSGEWQKKRPASCWQRQNLWYGRSYGNCKMAYIKGNYTAKYVYRTF